MEIQKVQSSHFQIPDSWTELATLYEKAGSLYQDMAHNPQNTLKDLDQLIALAQQMEAISSKMPIPPSAPGFHADFEGFLSSLTQMKANFLSGVAFNFAEETHLLHASSTFLNNICRDIFQG